MTRTTRTKAPRSTKALAAGLLAATLTAATLGGCDFLDKEPLGELTQANFFQTERDAVAATNATYSLLRSWNVHVFNWLGMTSIVSDEAVKGSTPTDGSFLLAFENLDWNPTNGAFGGTWEGYYQGVYRANVAIQNIPAIEMDEAFRARLMGENKFLRAYYYFFLVRAYGGVPLITEPFDAEDEFEQPRATAEEVYALIEQDLTEAAEALPLRSAYPASELGRATRGAAQGLLAKVYLFQGEYESAQAAAEQVIGSGEYALHPDYGFIFTQEGEFSSGSVFEIQAVALEEGGGSSQYGQVQGVRGRPNLGWGFNQPSDRLEELYEPGDRRQQATILYPWELLAGGTGEVVYLNPNLSHQQYNEKAQTPQDTPGGAGNSPVNIRRLRYADVLLIAAEAAYRNGDAATAQGYLNQVRERARAGQSATLGLIPETLDEELATGNLGLSEASHVFVRYANGGGPAEGRLQGIGTDFLEAGAPRPALVENIDIIRSVAGMPVQTMGDYEAAIQAALPGEPVAVEVLRLTQQAEGEEVTTSQETLQIEIEAAPYLPDVTATGGALLRAIWHERGIELAMEQHRWFDIIRQGRADEVMAAVGETFQDYQRLYPIPQSEIDLSGGLIDQNPGY